MVEIIADKIFLDGFEVAEIRVDAPASIRDRFEILLKQIEEVLEECPECARPRL